MLPQAWQDETDAVAQAYKLFCYGVIDVVAPIVPVVKPQMAFFEELGPAGMRVLKHVIDYARQKKLLVLLDGKRNDIGSTAEAYAAAYLGDNSPWGGDAITINPYLGDDAIDPFVRLAAERNAGVFILVKTSNPGSKFLQDRICDDKPLFATVGQLVETLAKSTESSCGYGAVGAVVGATYPDQVAQLRQTMPHTWLLIPGIGAQGGKPSDVTNAFDSRGLGAIINCSRSIIFAAERPEYRDRFGSGNWQDAVDVATRDTIREFQSAGVDWSAR
jgi:orotidine-5'-phosphate decarboxylase